MSAAVDIEIQINSDWRIVVVSGGLWGPRAWLLEHLIDGEWCGEVAAIRASGMLREFVTAKVGTVDAVAAAQLAALAPRSDIGGPKAPTGKRARAAEMRTAAPASSPASSPSPAPAIPASTNPPDNPKRAAAGTTAADFLRWRAEQNQNTHGGRFR
jgi:hypothetical protein